jgi:hypothetical protein
MGLTDWVKEMTVVHLSALRRGGLRRDRVWVERAFPEHQWRIADVYESDDGQRRVEIEPLDDPTSYATYSESYFRRHFIDRTEWIRRKNERVLRAARRKNSGEVLHEMATLNSRVQRANGKSAK